MSQQPKLVLTYFGFPGRGQSIRWALKIGKIPFEDRAVDGPTFGKEKGEGKYPLGSVPVLDVNGARFCESNSLTRYAGKLANLYPHDVLDALRVDEILDMVEDMFSALGPTFAMPAGEKEAARQKLLSPGGAGHKVWAAMAKRHAENGGSHFLVGTHLTIADLKLCGVAVTLRSGFFDGIAATWIDDSFPELGAALTKTIAEINARAN